MRRSEMTKQQLADRIRRRLLKIIRDCAESIEMAEAWAILRPEEQPIDCESFRVAKAQAERALRAWDAGETTDRSYADLLRYMKREGWDR